MRYTKIVGDWLFRAYLDSQKAVPSGLVELQKYFRNHGPITFTHHPEDGMIVAVSQNFRFGSIVTFGKDEAELDVKIKDAILTSFGIPSSYSKEACIQREGAKESLAYAAA